jgi:cytochrome c biogenesis protein CcmG, thiol:disulfide interchange protein DsbE
MRDYMTKGILTFMGVMLAAAICLAVSLASAQTPAPAEQNNLLKPGTPAPIFSLPGVDGNRTALRTWCGDTLTMPHINKVRQTVVISFWATWCKPCMNEMPQIIAITEQHKTDSIKIFCISIDKEGILVVRPFLQDKGWTQQVLLDPYAKTAERYGVKSLPALFVIDPRGVIRYASSGFEEGTDIIAKLDGVLAEIASGTAASSGKVDVTGGTVTGPSASGVAPKDRWRAVVRIECGEKIETVAQETGVDKEIVKQWYEEIKQAAMTLWGEPAKK